MKLKMFVFLFVLGSSNLCLADDSIFSCINLEGTFGVWMQMSPVNNVVALELVKARHPLPVTSGFGGFTKENQIVSFSGAKEKLQNGFRIAVKKDSLSGVLTLQNGKIEVHMSSSEWNYSGPVKCEYL